MGQNDRDSRAPASKNAETELIDASWDDDDLVSGVELAQPEDDEDVGDRVTAIPSMPPEMMAEKLMAQAPPSLPPQVTRATPATPTGMKAVRAPSLEMPFTSPSSPTFDGEDEPPTEPKRVPSVDDLDLSPNAPPLELDLSAGGGPVPTEPPTPAAPAAVTPMAPALSSQDDPETEMKDRYAMGDFTGALVVAESLLDANPEDEQAARYAESCRDVLTQMYSARLGPSDQTVVVAVPPDQIRWLSLDHRAGFLLSMIDGTSSIDEILDVSGMARLEAMRILFMLYEQQVIRLEPSSG